MRLSMNFLLLSLFVAFCVALNGNGPNTRNLILTEQELRFAGSALREVLATNVNSYVSPKLLKIHHLNVPKLLMAH
jgi:hypothetical protein